VPRVRHEHTSLLERHALAAITGALLFAVVLDNNGSRADLEEDGRVLARRQLLLRVAAVVAVGSRAVTDVQAQAARVEPHGRDTLAVVAAVAAVGRDVDDVAPATDCAGRVDNERNVVVERDVDGHQLAADTAVSVEEMERAGREVRGARHKRVSGVHADDAQVLDGSVGGVVPRVGRVDLDVVELGAVAVRVAALGDAVVVDIHASGNHVQANSG